MSPLDILAAARGNPVGPYLPAKEEWFRRAARVTVRVGQSEVATTIADASLGSVRLVTDDDGQFTYTISSLTLDVRRPEVRDHLVRCGCPEWARDVPAAMWCWARDGYVILGERWAPRMFKDDSRGYWRRMQGKYPDASLTDLNMSVRDDWEAFGPLSERPVMGYRVTALTTRPGEAWSRYDVRVFGKGAETGPEGRACADIAALRAGCILEEADGWYVPLLGDDAGWWAKEGA